MKKLMRILRADVRRPAPVADVRELKAAEIAEVAGGYGRINPF